MDRFEGVDEIDFAAEFSIPYPSHVFLTLLGLPWRRPRFLAMKDGIIRPDHVTGSPGRAGSPSPTRRPPPTRSTYFNNDVLDQRQVEGRDDILTTFLHTEVDGHRLTREDILDICFLFFIAGLDTVTASLDCFFAYLARQPEQRRRLAEIRASSRPRWRSCSGGSRRSRRSPAWRSRTPSWAAVPSRPAST